MQQTNASSVQSRVDAINWFHRIDLGNGIVTPGRDNSPEKLRALDLPRLTGKTVLDIGAWDGFFSFAAERAGASRVLAVDAPAWRDEPWGTKAGFELAREVLGSAVEDHYSELEDLTPESVGTFDVALLLGVLYHVKDPLGLIERVASLTTELLVLETLIDMTWISRPAVALYPTTEMAGDDSNWWGPNPAAVIGMLHAAGFREARQVGRPSAASGARRLFYNAANVAHSKITPKRPSLHWSYVQSDRGVFHAQR
jgi:tRNA (mo5U34)-methyltransferase